MGPRSFPERAHSGQDPSVCRIAFGKHLFFVCLLYFRLQLALLCFTEDKMAHNFEAISLSRMPTHTVVCLSPRYLTVRALSP